MMERDNRLMGDLLDATSRFFYAILRVDLMKENVRILQSRDLLQNEHPEMPWEVYLNRYSGIVAQKDFEFLNDSLSCGTLKRRIGSQAVRFFIDVPYIKNGKTEWLTISVILENDEEGIPYAYVYVQHANEEYVQRKMELEEARRQIKIDPLTGLFNFMELRRQAEEALLKAEENLALLFIDLDNFKGVNDRFGHMEGDLFLQKIAETMKGLLEGRGVCGRVGGDEFLVLLRGVKDRKYVENIAKQICDEIYALPIKHNEEMHVSCSIGITMIPEDGRDYQTLVRMADYRTYQAKDAGKNRYWIE